MLDEARRQAPDATFVQGDALSLPFEDGAFERVFTAHFYGHLEGDERERFLAEARRRGPGARGRRLGRPTGRRGRGVAGARPERRLASGRSTSATSSRTPLAAELGGGDTVFAGRWFVAVCS